MIDPNIIVTRGNNYRITRWFNKDCLDTFLFQHNLFIGGKYICSYIINSSAGEKNWIHNFPRVLKASLPIQIGVKCKTQFASQFKFPAYKFFSNKKGVYTTSFYHWWVINSAENALPKLNLFLKWDNQQSTQLSVKCEM